MVINDLGVFFYLSYFYSPTLHTGIIMLNVRSFFVYTVLITFFNSTYTHDFKKCYAGESLEVIQDAFNQEQAWGLCTSIDLHGCRNLMVESPESEAAIQKFVIELCKLIDMTRYGAPAIKWFGTGDVQGYTLLQLIETSCISAHWADDRMFLDIFSCKFYDPYIAIEFVKAFFQAEDVSINIWIRV